MSTDGLATDRDGAVLRLTLNRPGKLNALTRELLADLLAAVIEAERDDDVRAILITGAGRGFCAGADLEEAGDARELLTRYYNPLVTKLIEMGKPVIAAINGVAAGAGVSLALAADLRIAAEGARFIVSSVAIAAVPDAGATWTLPRLVGRARASEMALLGRPVIASEALGWGLANRVVPDAELATAAAGLAGELASAPRAVGQIKQALAASETNDLSTQLALEVELQDLATHSPDFAEAALAFTEKRSPVFGRG